MINSRKLQENIIMLVYAKGYAEKALAYHLAGNKEQAKRFEKQHMDWVIDFVQANSLPLFNEEGDLNDHEPMEDAKTLWESKADRLRQLRAAGQLPDVKFGSNFRIAPTSMVSEEVDDIGYIIVSAINGKDDEEI